MLALLIRVRCLVSSRIDAGCDEALVFASASVGMLGAGGLVGELATPALDPPVVIVRRPPATVLGLVRLGASDELLGLSHLRRVDQFL